MLIRCEKCSTTYELEERLIPPGGAPVQCSRCEHVFRAYPPSRNNGQPGHAGDRRPGLELVPPPANDLPVEVPGPQLDLPVEPAEPVTQGPSPEAPEVAPVPAPDEQVEPPPAAPYAGATKTPTPAAAVEPRAATPTSSGQQPVATVSATHERGPTGVPAGAATYKPPPGPVIPPGKPVRKVPNPELEGDTASVAPMPRKAVSFDVKPHKRGKSSWIVNGAVGLLALLVLAGTFSWWQERRAARAPEPAASPAPSRAATRERQDALKLLMRDDAASVERAAAQLDDVVRREPASAARADRALALALLSQQAKDQADRLESRARTLDEERARGGETATPDAAARSAELAAEAENARVEISPLRERAGRLLSEARAELDALPANARGDVAAARARAWIQLVSGERDGAAETARRAPSAADDPWLALVAVVAELREGATGDAHQRTADHLEQLAGKHPEFVRPLLLAGRIRAGLGDGERALADLDAVLKLNPQHAEARRVRSEIAPAIPESAAGAEPAARGDAGARDASPR